MSISACWLTFLLYTLGGYGYASYALAGQEPLAPLTRDELIDLFGRPMFRRHPERVLENLVVRNKVAFLPTRSTVRYLNDNGVPRLVTDALKDNFASRITYRVCTFEPNPGVGVDFAALVGRTLANTRIALKTSASILNNKTFDPTLCDPAGPTREELLFQPHTGYVVVMGDVERNEPVNGMLTVTARLVFVSRVQEKMIITKPTVVTVADSKEGWNEAAERISRWSIRSLEDEIE